MRYRYYESDWDCMLPDELTDEIINLDKAHKRAKKELRKQQKALAKKNDWLDTYSYMLGCSQKRERELELTNKALLNELEQCNQSISNLELKIVCLEQENSIMRKEQTNSEKKVQERIIQSMNDTMVELRAQLNETEEKYLQLLKRVAGEDEK